MALSKIELIKKLKELGIRTENNSVFRKDVKQILAAQEKLEPIHFLSKYKGKKGDTEDFLYGRILRIADQLGKYKEARMKLSNMTGGVPQMREYCNQLAWQLEDSGIDQISNEIEK